MANALPDHSTATLQRYGKAVFDRASRAFRALPCDATEESLHFAMTALRLASKLYSGGSRTDFQLAAMRLNDAARSLSTYLATQGEDPFTF